jgi:hypothetical protein
MGMTRSEAIKVVGQKAVEAVDGLNCDFTNRVTNGTEWDGYCEFAASIDLEDGSSLIAYYYQDEKEVDRVEDLGSLTWEVDHYEVM